jgi:hypothetical protein
MVGHCSLPFSCTAHRVDDTGEFDQESVAGGLDYAAVVLRDLGIDQRGPKRLEPRQRAFFVRAISRE